MMDDKLTPFDEAYLSLVEKHLLELDPVFMSEFGAICIDEETGEEIACPLADEEEIVSEEIIGEKIRKKKVVRAGKRIIKYVTDKPGYRIQMVNGRPKEVKMSPKERLRRAKSAKRASRKRKKTSKMASRKRKKSVRKRASMGLK